MRKTRTTLFALALGALISGAPAQDKSVALIDAYAALAPRVDKARTAIRRDRPDRAEKEIRYCLDRLPEHQEAHFLMSQILYQRGEYARALDHILGAEAGYVKMAAALSALERQKLQKRSEDMLRLSDEIAALEASAETVKNRGSCLPDKYDQALQGTKQDLTREEEERARSNADKKDDGGLPAVYAYWHGNILFMLKERPAAEAQYRRALAKDPDLGEAYNNLINLLFMDGRLDEARETLARAAAHKARVHPELKKAVLGRR
jgi:tetratricopeptide (TPR) repeat protein